MELPTCGDPRDSIILAGQPAAPSSGPGSIGVATLPRISYWLHRHPSTCSHLTLHSIHISA